MSDLGPARSIVLLASYYLKLTFFTKINSEHVAFSYCACSTSYSGWAYNRVKIPEIQKKGDWKRPPTPYVKGLTSGEALRVIIALANNYMEDCATVLYPWFLALLSTRDHSGPGRYLREVSLYH